MMEDEVDVDSNIDMNPVQVNISRSLFYTYYFVIFIAAYDVS